MALFVIARNLFYESVGGYVLRFNILRLYDYTVYRQETFQLKKSLT